MQEPIGELLWWGCQRQFFSREPSSKNDVQHVGGVVLRFAVDPYPPQHVAEATE